MLYLWCPFRFPTGARPLFAVIAVVVSGSMLFARPVYAAPTSGYAFGYYTARSSGEAMLIREALGPGWHNFFDRQSYSLRHEQMYVQQLSRMQGNCVFEDSLSLSAGGGPAEVRELALNSSTCQALMQKGTPPVGFEGYGRPHSARAAGSGHRIRVSPMLPAVWRRARLLCAPVGAGELAAQTLGAGVRGGPVSPAGCGGNPQIGHAFSKYVGLGSGNVSSVTDGLSWWYDSICADPPFGGYVQRYAEPGWVNQGGSDTYTQSQDCTHHSHVAGATMESNTYCPPNSTYTYYTNVYAIGDQYGGLSGHDSTYTAGACTSTLQHYFSLTYGS